MHKYYRKLTTVIRSPYFFYFTLILFISEATWIALSARYPMAFDENYHVGIISIYSHQFSPFFAHQPAGPAPYGALLRDPSYLYHWLMSFPYRWLNDFGFRRQIITLRFINIGLFAASLALFKCALRKTKSSEALVNITLFLFILIPVVPQLAGQINYDNLQFAILAGTLLLTIRFREALLFKKQFLSSVLSSVICLCLLGSLVKFTFLPFLAGLTVYFVYLLARYPNRSQLLRIIRKNWRFSPRWGKWASLSCLVISLILFIQMYGVNIVKYHNLIPQCGQVLSVNQCLAYSPWARNYVDAHSKRTVNPNPIYFTGVWVGGMFERSFFVINGPGNTANYENRILPLISITAAVLMLAGLVLLIRYGLIILKQDPILGLLLFISSIYIASLWGRNYHDYLQLGQPVAINGRYLIPVILPVILAAAAAYQRALINKFKLKLLLATVALVGFTQGGGTLSYIYVSNENWYWPGDTEIIQLNNKAQKIIKLLIIGKL